MRTEFSTFSNAGPDHENEDASFISITPAGLWTAIADGVGGHGDGREASTAAMRVFTRWVETESTLSAEPLFQAIQLELQSLLEQGRGNSRMATTFTAMRLDNGEVEFAHVGDTRLYHLRGGGIVTRTRDQSEVQELLDRGILSRHQADKYARKNILTSVLGANRSFDLMTGNFKVSPGDRMILCTDGVHGSISKRDMVELSSRIDSAVSLSKAIEQAVLVAGPTDDYSATVINVDE